MRKEPQAEKVKLGVCLLLGASKDVEGANQNFSTATGRPYENCHICQYYSYKISRKIVMLILRSMRGSLGVISRSHADAS